MNKLVVRRIVVSGLVIALSARASITGMTLAERVTVADFIGVVRIRAVHASPNGGKPEAQREDWFRQTAEAIVIATIKGKNIPSHITIQFDNGLREQSPNVLYDADAEYLVFLAREFDGVYSTCVQGQYAIHGAAVGGWPGAAGSVTLDAARNAIATEWSRTTAEVTPPAVSKSGSDAVQFTIRICEGKDKLKFWFNDEARKHWKACSHPIPDVPVSFVSDSGEQVEGKTGKDGIVSVPKLSLLPHEKFRMAMACTTHNCFSLHGLFVGAPDITSGMNTMYAETVPKAGSSQN